MPDFLLEDYFFTPSPTTPAVWSRKCYGMESVSSSLQEELDGYCFITATLSIRPAYPRDTFAVAVKAAWIRLRHSLPGIAVKSFRQPPPDNRFYLTYDSRDVQAWAEQTVVFSDELKDLYEAHLDLRDRRWWKPSDGRWVGELHVSPIEGGWQLSTVFNHNSCDGRSVFEIMNELLKVLVQILESDVTPLLPWGAEVARLAPASIVICAPEAKTGEEPTGLSQVLDLYNDHQPLWTWPVASKLPSQSYRDSTTYASFPVGLTSLLHKRSKAHGRTVTQTLYALSILAYVEVSLINASHEQMEIMSKAFKKDASYNLAFDIHVNYKHKFPSPYTSFSNKTAAPPLSTFDGIPVFLPMESLQRFFFFDETTCTVKVRTGSINSPVEFFDAFWNGFMQAIQKSLKEPEISLEAFATREKIIHEIIHEFDRDLFLTPGLFLSSIGDLERLDTFEDYRPSKGNETLTLDDVLVVQRMGVPGVMAGFWEYDGKMRCQWGAGGQWMGQTKMDEMVAAFHRWTEVVCARHVAKL